jgi:hypothetical protein
MADEPTDNAQGAPVRESVATLPHSEAAAPASEASAAEQKASTADPEAGPSDGAEGAADDEAGAQFVPVRPGVGVGAATNARLTLTLTTVIFLTTFIAWGSGKAACNHHPPHYHAISQASTSRLLVSPKDAGLEFQHRLQTHDFVRAREAATGDAQRLVDEAEQACDAACRAQTEERREYVKTRAIVRTKGSTEAKVAAQSFYGDQEFSGVYRVVRDGAVWKVAGLAE